MKKTVFEVLNKIDCSKQIEKKNGLNYISWAWAWGILKANYPNSNYKVYENKEELNYFHDNRTAWVKVGVEVDGVEYVEMLPVMDYRHQSIPKDKLTSFNVNTAIQRALTKAIARHGLGLYLYAGEDIPTEEAVKKSVPLTNEQVSKYIYSANTNEDLNKIWKKLTDEQQKMFLENMEAKSKELKNK